MRRSWTGLTLLLACTQASPSGDEVASSESAASESESDGSASETGPACEPTPETCASPLDEDCDGSAICDPSETFAWLRVLGTEGFSHGTAIDVAPDGTLWIGGELDGTIDVVGEPISALANRGRNLFVARLDGDGQGLGASAYLGFDDAALIDLALDSQGEATILGTFSGGLDLGGGGLPGPEFPEQQVFLAGYGPTGEHRFSRTWIGSRDAGALAIGPDDRRIITGRSAAGLLDLGGGALPETSFLASFDALGQHQWSRSFDLGAPAVARGLAIAADGSIFVLADYAATSIDLGGVALEGDGSDLVLARFDASGVPLWAERSTCDSCRAHDLVQLDDGDLLLVARFASSFAIADQSLEFPASARSIAFARLDPQGQPRWLIGIPDATGESRSGANARAIADAAGNAFLALDMAGSHDLGLGPLSSPGLGSNIFVLEQSPLGQPRWSQRYGGVDPSEVDAIALDDQGGLIMTGLSSGTIDFGGGEQLLDSPPKAFVVRLAPP